MKRSDEEIKKALVQIKKREVWNAGMTYCRLMIEWIMGESDFAPWENGDDNDDDDDPEITVDETVEKTVRKQ